MAIQLCLTLTVLAAFVASLYGWGRAVAKLSYGDSEVPIGYATSLGIAVWIFLGGILTSLALVSPGVLYVIFYLGVLLSGFFLVAYVRSAKTRRGDSLAEGESGRTAAGRGQRLAWVGCYASLVPVLIFLTLTQLPVRSFHIHDDMMLYLPRVERILQVGSINDPFDPVGLDSFGAMPFLQAFIYAHFPITYISGCDSVLCYLLCAALVLELARELGITWGHALLAVLLLLSIRIPEYNASPVYAGSLMILLAMMSTCRLARVAAKDGNKRYRATIPIGLALAGLMALKLNMAFFAGCYFLILLAGLSLVPIDERRRVWLGLTIGLATVLAIGPWIAAYTGKYLMLFRGGSYPPRAADTAETIFATGMHKFWDLISPERSWGLGSLLDYLVLMVLAGVAFLVAIAAFKRVGARAYWSCLSCAAAAGAVLISFLFWQFFGLDTGNNMRYLGPLPAAVLPAAALIIIAAANRSTSEPGSAKRPSLGRLALVVAVLEAFVIGLFLDTTIYRAQHAWSAYPFVENESGTGISAIQSMTKPGQCILAWVKTPRHIDFTRNEIFLVYQSGLLAPWLDFPPVADQRSADEFFARYGIRYLFRERMDVNYPTGDNDINGMKRSNLPYFREMGSRFAMLRDMFSVAEIHHKVIFNNGRIVLIDLAH